MNWGNFLLGAVAYKWMTDGQRTAEPGTKRKHKKKKKNKDGSGPPVPIWQNRCADLEDFLQSEDGVAVLYFVCTVLMFIGLLVYPGSFWAALILTLLTSWAATLALYLVLMIVTAVFAKRTYL